MPTHSPLPTSLPKECQKAAVIFNSFAAIIPQELLRDAKGFAILVIAKAGFLFSARAGSGLVIVKLPDGSWSAPSAIGTGGLGVGGQIGAELSEFVMVLNSRSAIQSFMSAGSINLGGNLSIAVGPVGRNAEATGSLNKLAAMYSYSRTKGLFGGASLEGSVIFERSDANEKAYAAYADNDPYQDDDEDDFSPSRSRKIKKNKKVSAKALLSGQIPCPPWAKSLVNSIERRAGGSSQIEQNWIDDRPDDYDNSDDEDGGSGRNRGYSFGSDYASNSSDRQASFNKSTSPKDKLAASAKGRLRGYSLGNFGRKSTNERMSSFGRQRSGTATQHSPEFRYRDNPEDEDEARRRKAWEEDNDLYERADLSYAERERQKDLEMGRSNDDYDIDNPRPPSPSSHSMTSQRSGSQKFSDFMKRPVLPERKSTTALKEPRLGGKNSPLSLSRNASFKKNMKANIMRFAPEKDNNEEGGGRGSPFDRRRQRGAEEDNDDVEISPFGDRFSPSLQADDNTFDFDRIRDAPSVEGSRSGSPVDGKRTSKKSSLLGVATSALSRPLGKRSFTAPSLRRKTTDDRPSFRSGDSFQNYRDREYQDDDYDFDQYQADGPSGSPFASTRGSGQNTARRLSPAHSDGDVTSEDERPRIAVHRNPFDEGAAAENSRQKKAQQDLLTDEDEAPMAISSSMSSMEIQQPRHRLDALYNKDNDDARSIRSIDSSTEFTFGNKSHKIVTNDFSKPAVRSPLSPPLQPQYRVGTFDFEGGEAGDLPFKTGDVIEIVSMDDPDWFVGRLNGKEGLIPVNRSRAFSAGGR